MKKLYSAILCGLFVFLALSCNKEKDVAVTSVSLSQPTAEMIIGETVQLSATVLPSDATDKSVTWASSKQSVATVTGSGKVTAVAEGVSTITASAGGKSASCTVTVSKGYVAVSSVTLNKTELALEKGQTETLTATINPTDATDQRVTWSSSASTIVSVDNSGKITAVAGGSAVITAKAGDKQATCTVTVTVLVESVSLDRESITIEEESSTTLVATVKPDDATDKTVTWSSSNNEIATVDEAGKVTAIKEGEATITAKAGEKTATCKVTVQKKFIVVTSVTLNKAELALEKGQSETLVATVAPEDATDKTVTWTTSDEKVATVDNAGKVTAVAGGSAIITAKAGEKEATCTVTVTVPLESISINKTELSLVKGQSETLVITFKPDDTTERTITWSSSNSSVASVDSDGRVTAIAGGSTTITAQGGGKQVTCSVLVTVPVESVTLDMTTITFYEGESASITATVKPDDATDKTIIWSSTDETIASVNQNGLVKALKEGTATIVAKAGNIEASCAVTVQHDSSNDPIVFADAIAKYACVEKFDANKDGEVSYAEAAAVTSLSGLFTNWDTVTSFEEIKYFTGVTSTYGVFSNLKYLKSITIPDNITRLGDFSGCISLEKVLLPQNLASLPTKCFINCTSLKIVLLPSSITAIPNYCFQYCSALESIEMPESVVSIGDYAFSSCHLLSNINIPTGLYSIGQRSFEDCPGIISLSFPESLSQLGVYSFVGCTSLATVAFHGSMTAIPEGVFNGCKSLSVVSWPENLGLIGDYAFFGCPLTDGNDNSVISIPESVTSIGHCCFSMVQHILLPSKQLVSISDSAFGFGTLLYVPQELIEPYRQRTNWRNYIPFIYDMSSYPIDIKSQDFVDLGLSVQWASSDMGSSKPEQAGMAYDWYENDIVPGLTNNISRTPTRAECQELIDNCQWTAGWMFGVKGVLITSGKAGFEHNWLFLPAGGAKGVNIYSERCYYWCLDKEQENGRHSVLYYDPYIVQQRKDIVAVRAGTVCPIRPVKK